MPGSQTTPGRAGARAVAPARVAFRYSKSVGARDEIRFAAQWPAYALPYRRFADALAGTAARLGADVDRYSFIVADLHRLLLAGLPAHSNSNPPAPNDRSCRNQVAMAGRPAESARRVGMSGVGVARGWCRALTAGTPASGRLAAVSLDAPKPGRLWGSTLGRQEIGATPAAAPFAGSFDVTDPLAAGPYPDRWPRGRCCDADLIAAKRAAASADPVLASALAEPIGPQPLASERLRYQRATRPADTPDISASRAPLDARTAFWLQFSPNQGDQLQQCHLTTSQDRVFS